MAAHIPGCISPPVTLIICPTLAPNTLLKTSPISSSQLLLFQVLFTEDQIDTTERMKPRVPAQGCQTAQTLRINSPEADETTADME